MRVRPYRLAFRFTHSKSLLHLSAGFVCALALSNAALPAAFSQTPSAPAAVQKTPSPAVAPAAPTAAATTAKAAPAKGAHEGIKVNGYWKIDVHNPDGTLDKHVEFENSLSTNDLNGFSGDDALVSILSNMLSSNLIPSSAQGTRSTGVAMGDPGIGIDVVPGMISINLASSKQNFYMPDYSPLGPCGSAGCILSTPSSLLYNNCLLAASPLVVTPIGSYETGVELHNSTASCFDTLTVSDTVSNFPQPMAPAIQLQGNFMVTTSGLLTSVVSIVTFCHYQNGSPVNCAIPSGTTPGTYIPVPPTNFNPFTLTYYSLPTPLPVGAGQAVNISVTLSFH